MTGHGGKRPNAGRTSVPISFGEMIEIGSRCEYLLRRQREGIAIARIVQSTPEKHEKLRLDIRSKRETRTRSIKNAKSHLSRKTMSQEFERYHEHAMNV